MISKRLRRSIILSILDAGEDVESMYYRKQISELVRTVLKELRPHQIKLILLKYYLELSNKAIAKVIGKSPNNVAVTLHNLRNKLKSKLELRIRPD